MSVVRLASANDPQHRVEAAAKAMYNLEYVCGRYAHLWEDAHPALKQLWITRAEVALEAADEHSHEAA